MFALKKSQSKVGSIGIEFRHDGIAFAKTSPADVTEIEHYGVIPCRTSQRADVLKNLVEEQDVRGWPCNVVLYADQYQVYPIEKPPVPQGDLPEASRWRVKDLIDYEIDQAVTDIFSYPQDALKGDMEKVNVVVCKKALVKEYVDVIQDAMLELSSIDVAELIICRFAYAQLEDQSSSSAMLYVRPGMSLMTLVKDNTHYLARHLEFRTEALSDPSHQQVVLQQLGLEVQRSFDYFESQMSQTPPSQLIVVGPDATTPLANMLSANIASQVQVTNLDYSRYLNAEHSSTNQVIEALPAMGAAMRSDDF